MGGIVLFKSKKIMIRIMVFITLAAIGACNRSNYLYENEVPKLPCKVQGACDATIIKFLTRFHKRGIKVVTVGQDYMISLPASLVFDDQSPHVKWGSYALLNEVADFLKQFRKIAITVTGFSSQYVSSQRERSLTVARSRVVSEYLWSRGVDSRFIFTQGLGRDKPIASVTQGGDKSPNARIEIIFRRSILN